MKITDFPFCHGSNRSVEFSKYSKMIPEYVEDPNHNTLTKRGCAILRFPFFLVAPALSQYRQIGCLISENRQLSVVS
jgi:hypothetical protein